MWHIRRRNGATDYGGKPTEQMHKWQDAIKAHLKEKKQNGMAWTGFIWLRLGTSENGDEPSASIQCVEFLD